MSDISILFALDAEELMLQGDFKEAIRLCEEGIRAFPDYISARSIYIKSLLLDNQIGKAKFA